MVRAWMMDDSKDDPRAPHKTVPEQPVTLEMLRELGVLYWKIPLSEIKDDNPDSCATLTKVRKDRHYVNFDIVTISREKLPNYEEKLKIFFTEHLHVDEEIRFCMEGSGYFDIRDNSDKWVRIMVEPGDMIVLPAGMYHRFTLDSTNYIKAMRLFQEEPKWIAYNRGPDTDEMEARKAFLEQERKRQAEVDGDEKSPNGVAYVVPNQAKSIAHYPHMREANGMLYVSGTSARQFDDSILGATQNPDGTWTLDIRQQTRAVLESIRKTLKQAGADLENLVDLTVFLTDMKDYSGMNEVCNEYFTHQTGPTRTTVAVRQLPIAQLLIEMKAVAFLPRNKRTRIEDA